MGRNRAQLAFDHHNMVPAPAGKAVVQTIFKSEDGILLCYGITKPTDGTAGYAIGCLFMHTDGDDGTSLYVNEDTATECEFNAVTVA